MFFFVRNDEEFNNLRKELNNKMVDPHQIKAVENTRNLFYKTYLEGVDTLFDFKNKLMEVNLPTLFSSTT